MFFKLFVFLLLISALFLLLLVPGIGLAQTPTWSRPVSVSGFATGSEFPTLAVDGNNDVYVVWASPQGSPSGLVYLSRWDSEAWSKPIDILFGSGAPSLVLDRYGELNLLYLVGSNATYARTIPDRAGSSKGWSFEQTLKPSPVSYAMQMLVDDESIVHIVRTQASNECSNCSSVLYQQSPDGGSTWSDPVTLSIQPADRHRVQLKMDSHGGLHVSWDGLGANGRNQSIRYTYSIDHGRTWAPAEQFFGPKGAPTQAAVGIAGNDQVVLVWTTVDHNEIYYQVSSDGGVTWGQSLAVPGIMADKSSTGIDLFDLAPDSGGTLHLAAVGRGANPDEPWLYHMQWDGKNWSKPEVVYGGPDLPEFPTLAVSNGNRLHLTWSTRNAGSVAGSPDASYQVWYSTMITPAPAAAPLPTFTPLQVISPTEAPTATAAPTATPPSFSVSNSSSSDETNPFQQQLSVLAGVIPPLLIIGLVVFIRSRTRHRV